ncbi:MAG: hypothetical protein FVQ81_06640 [Candidatus Glassbacteria bacterium]|nr:hypothetical protein [Candidatus Glassbacteria bacterium]
MTEINATEVNENGDSPENAYPKTGLVIVGILQVLLGGLAVLVAPMMIIGMVVEKAHPEASGPTPSAVMMIPGIIIYLGIGTWLIWMGIGSIKARRWARSLILVSSWLGLITGLGGLIYMSLMVPDMSSEMAKGKEITPAMAAVMKWAMIGFMASVGVIIPGVLILFYSRKKVKDTFEHRDPRIIWTDKCPLPILFLSGLCVVGALSMLNLGFNNWIMPFFGTILTGMAGATVGMVTMLLLGYAAWGIYKLNIKAWWLAAWITIAGALSMAITFSQVSLLEFFDKTGLPEQQLEMLKQAITKNEVAIEILFVVQLIVYFSFLLYMKRYFNAQSSRELHT